MGESATVDVFDADAPTVEVCERSRLVEDAIEAALPASIGRRGCDITLDDLGQIEWLVLAGEDGATFELAPGDLGGLNGLRALMLKGVTRLPPGIFEGVGHPGGVVIDFSENDPSDFDSPRAGEYDLSNIPGHILRDLQPQHALVLSRETDEDGEPLLTGLDRGSYIAKLGESFPISVPLYFDGNSDDPATRFYVTQLPYEFNGGFRPIVPDEVVAGEIVEINHGDVVRAMITVPEEEDESRGQWFLFVFSNGKEETTSLFDFAYINRN